MAELDGHDLASDVGFDRIAGVASGEKVSEGGSVGMRLADRPGIGACLPRRRWRLVAVEADDHRELARFWTRRQATAMLVHCERHLLPTELAYFQATGQPPALLRLRIQRC